MRGDQYEKLFGKEKYEILFIPYAKVAGTYDAYEKQVQDAFKPYGHKIVSISCLRITAEGRGREAAKGRSLSAAATPGSGDAYVRSGHH